MLRTCFCCVLLLVCACDSSRDPSKPSESLSTSASSGGGGSGGGAGEGGDDPGGAGIGGCTAQCDAQYPGANEILTALKDCIYCDACFDICSGDAGPGCATGRESGCSAQSTSCGQCATSQCAWNYDGENYTGVCAGAYEYCDKTRSCFNLDACLKDCEPR